jgi:phage host-nuclease inhibitor protein Gam
MNLAPSTAATMYKWYGYLQSQQYRKPTTKLRRHDCQALRYRLFLDGLTSTTHMEEPLKTTSQERCRSYMQQLKTETVALAEMQSKVDYKIKVIQDNFETLAQPLRKKIEKLEKEFSEHVEVNREELFQGKEKTMATPFGTFGYRATPEAVILDLDEKEVIDLVKSAGKKIASLLIKVKETIDKAGVKKAKKQKIVDEALLDEMGIRIEAGEIFAYAIDSQKL